MSKFAYASSAQEDEKIINADTPTLIESERREADMRNNNGRKQASIFNIIKTSFP